jgi:hypothetical protein
MYTFFYGSRVFYFCSVYSLNNMLQHVINGDTVARPSVKLYMGDESALPYRKFKNHFVDHLNYFPLSECINREIERIETVAQAVRIFVGKWHENWMVRIDEVTQKMEKLGFKDFHPASTWRFKLQTIKDWKSIGPQLIEAWKSAVPIIYKSIYDNIIAKKSLEEEIRQNKKPLKISLKNIGSKEGIIHYLYPNDNSDIVSLILDAGFEVWDFVDFVNLCLTSKACLTLLHEKWWLPVLASASPDPRDLNLVKSRYYYEWSLRSGAMPVFKKRTPLDYGLRCCLRCKSYYDCIGDVGIQHAEHVDRIRCIQLYKRCYRIQKSDKKSLCWPPDFKESFPGPIHESSIPIESSERREFEVTYNLKQYTIVVNKEKGEPDFPNDHKKQVADTVDQRRTILITKLKRIIDQRSENSRKRKRQTDEKDRKEGLKRRKHEDDDKKI